MKFTLAILAILTISSAVMTQTAPTNCAGTTTTWCVACDGTNCSSCYGGFLSSNKCTAPTTAVTNCMSYATATTCDMCDYTKVKLADGTCVAPQTTVTNCAYYQGTTAANAVCGACAVGTWPQGTNEVNNATAGTPETQAATIASCSSTAVNGVTQITNCAATYASNLPGNANPVAGTSVAIGAYVPACRWCSAGFVRSTDGTSCSAEGTANPGCAVGTVVAPITCSKCHPTTHQMAELNKCTVKPGSTYSAILSVASMIVALLFANF